MTETHTPVTDFAAEQIRAAFDSDWSALRRLYARDVRYRDPDGEHEGVEDVLAHLQGQVEAFAGFSYTIRHLYASADGAVAEWTMSGAYEGKPVTLDVVTSYDVRADRIVFERNYWDNASLFAQLGVDEE